VLDLGAGDAPYRALFDAAKCRYVCCDLGPDAEVPIVPGQPVAMAAGSADAVVSFQVLEHVWDLDWYLGECARLLKPEGTLILSTHGTWPYHPHPTDFRRWTRDGLVAELETRGFEVSEVKPLLGPLAWTTQFRALGYHAVLGKLPLLGSLLSALVCSLMHLRMKIEDRLTPAPWIATNAAVYVVLARKAAP
jgi:SAM-dependent methyltransferase